MKIKNFIINNISDRSFMLNDTKIQQINDEEYLKYEISLSFDLLKQVQNIGKFMIISYIAFLAFMIKMKFDTLSELSLFIVEFNNDPLFKFLFILTVVGFFLQLVLMISRDYKISNYIKRLKNRLFEVNQKNKSI